MSVDAPIKEAIRVEVIPGLDRVQAAEWDALVPKDDPFCTHAFLLALEDSGSVGKGTGWLPAHVLVRRAGTLVGAMPLYVKGHSYGEYIFDWGWAEASQQAGIPYYPKLVSAVPFTPATGRRLLVADDVPAEAVQEALLAGVQHVAKMADAWSAHLLFLTPEEHQSVGAQPGWIGRMSHQYHWTNAGYDDFDHWLSHFRSRARKETRRERRIAQSEGVGFHWVAGADLSAVQWGALETFYRATCDRKWGRPYLEPGFFELAPDRLKHLVQALLVEHKGQWVAGALMFQAGKHLYGRYWGCKPGYNRLHMEVCYHRPIERCIAQGWTRFEAGAQGEHKLKRGLMPTPTWSAHWLRHDGLAQAVHDATQREAVGLGAQLEKLAEHGPFRRG